MRFGNNKRKMVRNIISIGLFSFFLLLTTSSTSGPNTPVKNQVKKIVIDAGHGGHDPGTSGKYTKEKEIALKIALELGAIVETYLEDVEVIYTRKNDTFVDLDRRADIANKNHADLFISVHCNAFSRKDVHGTETYVLGTHKTKDNLAVAKRENSVILMEEDYQDRYDGFDP